jgi:hypothetical protein
LASARPGYRLRDGEPDKFTRIAELFGIPLTYLYAEPEECLRVAVEHFADAPIRRVVRVPEASKKGSGVVVNLSRRRKRAPGGLHGGT